MISNQQIWGKIKNSLSNITPIQIFVIGIAAVSLILLIKYLGLKEEWKTVRIEVVGKPWYDDYSNSTALRPPGWLIGRIKPGNIEYGYDGKEIAKILNVEEYSDIKPSIYLTAKLRVIYNKNTQKYSFKNKLIDPGMPIDLNLPLAKISGQVIETGLPNIYETKNIIIHGRIRNAESWLQNSISVGDMMLNLADKSEVARVQEKSIEPPSSIVFFNNPGYFTDTFLEKNPRLKDIILTIKAKIIKYPEGWRFTGNQIVKVGNTIRLSFANYELPYLDIQDFRDE